LNLNYISPTPGEVLAGRGLEWVFLLGVLIGFKRSGVEIIH